MDSRIVEIFATFLIADRIGIYHRPDVSATLPIDVCDVVETVFSGKTVTMTCTDESVVIVKSGDDLFVVDPHDDAVINKITVIFSAALDRFRKPVAVYREAQEKHRNIATYVSDKSAELYEIRDRFLSL